MNDGFIKVKWGVDAKGKDIERFLKFNMRAIESFTEVKAAGTLSTSASVTLVYAGLIGHCYAKQVEPDFTFEEVNDWVEDKMYSGDVQVLADIDKCFETSRAFIFTQEQAKKREAKKKKLH